jgi:plastocyanin
VTAPTVRRRAVRVFAFAIVALFGLAACGSDDEPAAPPAPVDLRGRAAVDVDAVRVNRFEPVDVIVNPGTKVTWHNKDSIVHNVKKKADIIDFGGPFGVDTSGFGSGATYSFTFAKEGVFFYTCSIHSGMDGKVQVLAGSAAPTTSSTG